MGEVDYSALAKQNGATSSTPAGAPGAAIDYSALAKQNGATSSTPVATANPIMVNRHFIQMLAGGAGLGGGFLGNVLGSAKKFAGDMVGPLLHPADTLQGIVGLGEGMAEKGGAPAVNGQSHQANVDALVKMYSDRYGSFDNFRKTLYNDPVGVLSDVSLLASGGGAVAKGVELGADALKADAVANAARAAGTAAFRVSDLTNPLSLAGKAAGAAGAARVADNFADWTAQKLRTLSLKGGYKINADPLAVADAARTMGEQKIPLSDAGLQKITGSLADLQLAKQNQTAQLAAAGVTIDPNAVAARADVLKRSAAGATQVNPQKDIADIEKVKQNFLTANPGPIPIDQAEALKEGTYSNNKYGPSVPPQLAATAKAEKALAAGIKEEIETQFPEIGQMNAGQAKLINLQGVMEQAVRKYSNSGGLFGSAMKGVDPLKISLGAGGLAAAGHFGGPEAAAGAGAAAVVATLLKDPVVQSRLAAAIDWGRANAAKAGSPLAVTGNGMARVHSFTDSLQPQQQQ